MIAVLTTLAKTFAFIFVTARLPILSYFFNRVNSHFSLPGFNLANLKQWFFCNFNPTTARLFNTFFGFSLNTTEKSFLSAESFIFGFPNIFFEFFSKNKNFRPISSTLAWVPKFSKKSETSGKNYCTKCSIESSLLEEDYSIEKFSILFLEPESR